MADRDEHYRCNSTRSLESDYDLCGDLGGLSVSEETEPSSSRSSFADRPGSPGLSFEDDDDFESDWYQDACDISHRGRPVRRLERRKEIEIAPGVRKPLRSAKETIRAVARDCFVPTVCVVCDKHPTIFCVADAEYILCPNCKTISPMEGGEYGVGLGFTVETLAKIQMNILKRNEERRKP